jgi:uncharacterized protein (UPF0332 family)
LSDDDALMKEAWERLEAAEYLFKGGYYKDSVSRSYYSMFFAARALLSLNNVYPKTHKGVISSFGLEYVKDGFIEEMHGRAIRDAKDIREEADYGIGLPMKKDEAHKVLDDAKKFVETVEEAIEKVKGN